MELTLFEHISSRMYTLTSSSKQSTNWTMFGCFKTLWIFISPKSLLLVFWVLIEALATVFAAKSCPELSLTWKQRANPPLKLLELCDTCQELIHTSPRHRPRLKFLPRPLIVDGGVLHKEESFSRFFFSAWAGAGAETATTGALSIFLGLLLTIAVDPLLRSNFSKCFNGSRLSVLANIDAQNNREIDKNDNERRPSRCHKVVKKEEVEEE